MIRKRKPSPFVVPVALAVASLGQAAEPGRAILRAFVLDQEDWAVEANLKSCVIRTRAVPVRTGKLAPGDCERVRKLASRAARIPAGAHPAPLHGRRYVLELDNRRLPVRFRAPENCEIQPDGDLHCVRNRLEPSEELLRVLERARPR